MRAHEYLSKVQNASYYTLADNEVNVFFLELLKVAVLDPSKKNRMIVFLKSDLEVKYTSKEIIEFELRQEILELC